MGCSGELECKANKMEVTRRLVVKSEDLRDEVQRGRQGLVLEEERPLFLQHPKRRIKDECGGK